MNVTSHPPHTPSTPALPGVPVLLVALAAFATLLAPMKAHALSCVQPPEYAELEAQIDEVWKNEAFDCLLVEHEIRTEPWEGHVEMFADIGNACGEDVWVVWGDERAPGQLVADGELVTVRERVAWPYGVSQGDGEFELRVLFDADLPTDDLTQEAVYASDYTPLSRVWYSYAGTPNPETGCGPEPSFYGCAVSHGGSDAPVAPLTLIGVAMLVRRTRGHKAA